MSAATVTKSSLSVIWVAALVVGAVSPASAALTLTNGGFDDGTGGVWGPLPSGFVPDGTNPGWNGFGDYGNAAGVWFDPGSGIAPTFPIFTGSRAGSLIGVTDGDEAVIYQSLGMIEAGDLGKTFLLSADMGARGFAGRSYDGVMTVAFATSSIVVLGTPDALDITTNPSLLNPPPAFGLFTRTASYSPTAGDIGTEVFAAIHLVNQTTIVNDENQFVVDNVTLAAIPEPSTFALLLLAIVGIVTAGRRCGL